MILRKFRFCLIFFKIILSISLFFGLERLCHLATDGFAVVRIKTPLPKDEEFQTTVPSDEQLKALHDILSQPFYYLRSGGQSYVFESADKTYVIKFFKFHHMRIPPWLKYVPTFTTSLEKYRERKLLKKKNVIKKTFRSYKVAEKYLGDEAALIFLHLSPTAFLKTPLTLYDRIGVKIQLPLDHVAFAIQKKGTLAYELIKNFMDRDQIDAAKEVLSKMILLSVQRCQKGVRDEDPEFRRNFGFIGDTPLQLDTGRLVYDENEKNPAIFIPEIHRITKDLRKWLTTISPLLVDHLDQELALIDKTYETMESL